MSQLNTANCPFLPMLSSDPVITQLQQFVTQQQVFFSQPQNLLQILNTITNNQLLPVLPPNDGNNYTLQCHNGILTWELVSDC